MSRIETAFALAAREKRKVLITYLCAGDPSLEVTETLVPLLAQAGADILELGVPFSDPLADGPTIQAASRRALQAGATLTKILALVGRLRAAGAQMPIVLMGYYNPIAAMGVAAFIERSAAAGVDGLIVPDLPLEEQGPLRDAATAKSIDLVLLAAPTTPVERLARIGRATHGFLYFVSVAGVTGARATLPEDLPQKLEAARKVSAAPVAVGFGISEPQQVRSLSQHADGVVVGSALVQRVHEANGNWEPVLEWVRGLAAALRCGQPSPKGSPEHSPSAGDE